MVTACSSPPTADIDDLFVPALIDVGILEALETTGGIAPHLSRWSADRLAPVLETEALHVSAYSRRLSSAEERRMRSPVEPSAFLR